MWLRQRCRLLRRDQTAPPPYVTTYWVLKDTSGASMENPYWVEP